SLGARPAAEPLPRDGRLDARVTINLQDRFLEDALRELSPHGGPRLTATPPEAWDRVTVVARERPLREVLDGLAELLNYRWQSASNDDPPRSYRLAQTTDARRYEEQLWQDLVARSAEPLDKLVAYAQMPAA